MSLIPFPMNHTFVKGDDWPFQWVFKVEGVLTDQTSKSFWLTIKSEYADLDIAALATLDPADFTVGGTTNATVTALIPRAVTIDIPAGTHKVDLQAEDNSLLTTLGLGEIIVLDHVTIREV